MWTELKCLNETWLRAWFQKDAATVDALMASDYEYVAPNGQVLDRAAILGIIRSPSYRLDSGERTEVGIRRLTDDVAVVQHRWTGTGEYGGRPFRDDHRCTVLCVRRDGHWMVAHEQCSPIATAG